MVFIELYRSIQAATAATERLAAFDHRVSRLVVVNQARTGAFPRGQQRGRGRRAAAVERPTVSLAAR